MSSGGMARTKDLKADIVIIGGGGAGLAAAVAAAEKGASVIVLEKGGLGGNSALAWGLFAAESPAQKRALIDCRRDDCFKIAMNFAHWKINPRIVRAFIDKSGDTIRWLEEKGLVFSCSPFYPNQAPVTWHIPKGRGAALMKVLAQNCEDLGVQLLIHTPAKKILTAAKGNISGVLAETKGEEFKITAKSIIIATGGYGGNKKLLKKYCPNYQDSMECVGLPHTGDGLVMAAEIGATTEGLGMVQLCGPTPHKASLRIGTPPNIFRIGLMPIALEPYTLWVNRRGERFVDETAGYNHFQSSNAVARQPDNVTYTIFDSKMTQTMTEQGLVLAIEQELVLPAGNPSGAQGDKLPGLERELRAQVDKGLIKISNSWDEIADWIGADPKALKATIDEYNAACDQGYDPIFAKDRRYLMPLRTPPYYAIKCHAGFLTTIGGIRINEHTEVLDKQDNPIPGLCAAGVDTSGWESETYCDVLSGHACGFAINSGRIAGENAAKFVLGE